jgi:hypothetical protein
MRINIGTMDINVQNLLVRARSARAQFDALVRAGVHYYNDESEWSASFAASRLS